MEDNAGWSSVSAEAVGKLIRPLREDDTDRNDQEADGTRRGNGRWE